MQKTELFHQLKNKLIVSCQAKKGESFDNPEYLALFAEAAYSAGAAGIRSQGIGNIKKIMGVVPLPVIGLVKSEFSEGAVLITGTFRDVDDLIKTGCSIIAVDGTQRQREGLSGPQFIEEIKNRHTNIIVMADVAQYAEGIRCAESGADCISTTLSGYTPETSHFPKDIPDFQIVQKLAESLDIPVFAEGRIHTPAFAKKMIQLGAWAVVVGTAITRPGIITSWFIDAIRADQHKI